LEEDKVRKFEQYWTTCTIDNVNLHTLSNQSLLWFLNGNVTKFFTFL